MNEHTGMQRRQPSGQVEHGPPRVVYIAGWGRSGSTVIDQILGQLDDWFSCGELNLIWWNQSCSCGTPVLECAFWKPIVDEIVDRHADLDPQCMIAFQDAYLGANPLTLNAIASARRRPADRSSPLRRYAELVRELYASAAARAGARVLVDSSKTATDAYLISALTDVDLYVVHLVRDPRATAYSWSKRKAKSYDPLQYFGQLGPSRSSLRWLRRNAVIEALVRRRLKDRYLMIRYEDFVDDPGRVLGAICSLVGDPAAELPLTSARTVAVGPTHSVAGNPSRFTTGEIEITADDEWRHQMSRRSRLLATAAAAPLMPRYGYPFRSG